MSHDLTPKQAAILAFVRREIADKGRAPTMREVCVAFGFRSTNAASDHMWSLRCKGYIERDENRARGLRVLRAENMATLGAPVVVSDCGRLGVFMPVTRAGEERAA